MIRDLVNNIIQKKDIRQNLIQLKALLNEDSNKYAMLNQIGNDYAIFDELLAHEDAKIRKNTALIMGELAVPCFLEKLYETYQRETKLFVKSSYLKAMTNFDCTILLPDLKARLSELGKFKIEEDNKKHISEEMRILTELILDKEDNIRHTFVGYDVPSDLVLLTNRNYQYIIMEQLKGTKAQEFNAGVMVKTNNLKEIQSLRTYGELLFMLEDLKVCSDNVTTAAKAIAESSLLTFMEKRHSGSAPFYFRIELKSMLELDKKSAFTKKLGFEIERLTNRSLINSTSNYEFELRMIENKEGNYNILIKLYTLKDTRFSYRKNSISASIQPVNAALMAALAKKYLKKDAQVLDPFCGVGTMLLERCKLVPAKTMYGLDLFNEAILKAKENTEIAHAIIHYINRDFFNFKHDYLFDEIFTNMPRAIGHKDEEEIFTLYQKFFAKAPEHLKKGAVLVLYSHDRDYIKRLINPKVYRIEQEYEISRKEESYLFIIRYL